METGACIKGRHAGLRKARVTQLKDLETPANDLHSSRETLTLLVKELMRQRGNHDNGVAAR